MVYRSVNEAPTGEAPETEETIGFLKEQHWALGFGTQLATPSMLRESLLVPAEVTPRSGGEVTVSVPIAGRLAGEDCQCAERALRKGKCWLQ